MRVYTNRAVSGATLMRLGIETLMQDIREFDLVYAETLDRVSRDQEDVIQASVSYSRRRKSGRTPDAAREPHSEVLEVRFEGERGVDHREGGPSSLATR